VRAKQSPRMAELCAGNPDMLTAEFVAQAACEGDPAAVEIVLVAASALGKVLAPLVTALGPEMIILQGEIPRCGSTEFRDAIRAEIEATGYSAPGAAPAIAQTELPFSTTALGAAALALDYFFFSPQLATRGKSSPAAALL